MVVNPIWHEPEEWGVVVPPVPQGPTPTRWLSLATPPTLKELLAVSGDGKQGLENMESSSKIYGDGTEECQSSESGWTMYIGSSMDDDDDGGDGDGGAVFDGGGRKKGTHVKMEDEDTDDSMASDASSGPSHLHLQQPWEVQEDEGDGKHNQEKYKGSSKKNKKAAGKKKGGYDQETRKKDEGLVNDKRGVITTVQSGNRAWFLSKRK